MGKEIKVRVVMRNNTTDGWKLIEDTAVLYKGEIGLEFTAGSATPKMKIGDGRRPWKALEYFTVALPEKYTWGDLYGTVYKNDTIVDESLILEKEDGVSEVLELKYPGYPETVNIKDINKNFSNLSKKITSGIEVQIKIMREQINKFLGGWSAGQELPETGISREIIDARTRFKDTATYESIGDAIRAIDEDLQILTEQMAEFVGSSAIDGLYYEGNKLWVASNGQPIGDPVTIVSGSGGGGGGDASYVISLINLLDTSRPSYAIGEKVILEYKYTSKDSEGYSDGSGTGTLTVGGIKRATFSVSQGENILDITDYLTAGENNVVLQVANSDGSYRSLRYVISIVSLSVTTPLEDMKIYEGAVTFPYIVTGSGTKVVHFIMDGNEIGSDTIQTSGRSSSYNIPVQPDGGHIFEIYAEITSGATTLRSNILRRGMMWYSSTMTTTAILINNTIISTTQGETLTIPYLVYTPNLSETEIELIVLDEDGKIYSKKPLTVDGTEKIWTTQDYPAGLTTFKIKAGVVEAATQIQVKPSNFTKTIIQDGLMLEFSSAGRDNSEENPENWSYDLKDDLGNPQETIGASFSGFGWANADGWYQKTEDGVNFQTVLRFLPGNTMSIPFSPFSQQTIKQTGLTIEAEFATHDVKDSETTIVATYKDGKGLIIQASSAQLSATAAAISTRFREDSRIRITFAIEPSSANSFIYVYVNGILSGVTRYSSADDFTQDNLITIGADTSGLDLYTLRFYRRSLSAEEQLNNFIVDRPTLIERIKIDEQNNIFNEAGDITVNTLPLSVPYVILECEELPQFKGDKKKKKTMTFVDPINTNRSFTATGCQFDVQGTSSQGYPRKNYKIKLEDGIIYTDTNIRDVNGFPVFEGGISGRYICLKADFASSENANNVMLTDYYESLTPFDTVDGKEKPYPPTDEEPDEKNGGHVSFVDARCRRAIRGFGCVVFWKNTTTNEVSFIGKYNFNDDKANENVFGFNSDVNPATECWEFCNNTSNRVIFKETNFFDGEERSTDWVEGISYSINDIVVYKYPYKSLKNNNTIEPGTDETAWEKIPYKEEVMNDFEPRFPDLDETYTDYSAFYRMAKWVVSTDRGAVREGGTITIDEKGTVADTAENRLEKFKTEFTKYFAKDAMLFYYIFTEIFLMLDNRAKNLFLTTFDGIKWFPVPYDFDTAIGINNEGKLIAGYELEDTDKLNDADVFNGQNSVLWCNIRDAFSNDIRSMYISLRSNNEKPFSYVSLRDKMNNHQSIWPEALWNEDAYFKYLEPFIQKGENYLDMLQGSKESQRDWWLYYAFRYRDSKYRTGEAQSTYITLRSYDRQTNKLIIKPYSNLYIWAKFGSYEVYDRAKKNAFYELEIPNVNLNDTECYLYSADLLSEIGDLSPLKVGFIDISAATKLEKLVLGSDAKDSNGKLYENLSFEGVSVGTNELLAYLNIQNCKIDYTKHTTAGTIDLSNCHGIEEVLAKGSNIKAIVLADGGHLRTLELPATLTGFSVKNQEMLENLTFEGVNGIATLNLENTPNIPVEKLLLNCPLQRLRLKNIEWTVSNAEALERIYNKLVEKNENGNYRINGYNDAGNEVAGPQVTGRVHIETISKELIIKINSTFPELIIVANGTEKLYVKYVNKNNAVMYETIVNKGEDAIDPVVMNIIDVPIYPETENTKYAYRGWSYNNGTIGLPKNIQKPTTIIADYEETYRVRFFKNETLTEDNIYYITEDGERVQAVQWVKENTAARDIEKERLIEIPKIAPTAEFSWIYEGWRGKDTLADSIENLSNITRPIDLYPSYNKKINMYTVHFVNNGEILETIENVPYGDEVTYSGKLEEIKYLVGSEDLSDFYECSGWDKELIIKPEEYTDKPIEINAVFIFKGEGFITDSWSTIAEAAKNGDSEKYKLGMVKEITLTVADKTYTVQMELIAKNHDILQQTFPEYNNGKETAAFTFITKEVSPYKYNMNNKNDLSGSSIPAGTGGWKENGLRIHCNEEIYLNYIEEELQNAIKIVNKVADKGYNETGLQIVTDIIWVPSATELNLNDTEFVPNQGEPYAWFTNNSSRIRKDEKNNPVMYWTRSQATVRPYRYIIIKENGTLDTLAGSNFLYFPFGFCI